MGFLVPQQAEFLRDVADLIIYIGGTGRIVTGGELWRTQEQQQVYVASGKSQTMKSQHLKRLAIDLNIFFIREDGVPQLTYERVDLQDIGDFWEGLSDMNRWGGNWDDFQDTAHFERRTA